MTINFKPLTSKTISSRCQYWAFPVFCISALFIIISSVEAIHHWPNYIKWPSILLACTLPTGMIVLGWVSRLNEKQVPKEILWVLLVFCLALTSSLLSKNPWPSLKASVLFMVSGPFIFVSTKYLFKSARNREAYLWISSLAIPVLCCMGVYQYYSSGEFYLFSNNPLPDLGLLLLLSASPLILLHQDQPSALNLMLRLIILLFVTVILLSAKKGPLLSLLVISLCLVLFSYRKYYKPFLLVAVLSGLFLYFSGNTFQKLKGVVLAFANLVLVEPDYSKIIFQQIWGKNHPSINDLNKIAWSALSVRDHEIYKKMLAARNFQIIYNQIWDKDQAGNFTVNKPNDFDPRIWSSLPSREKQIYMEIIKARDTEWPKVDIHTNAENLRKIYDMPDRDFLELNIILNYWERLNRESMEKMQALQEERQLGWSLKVVGDQLWDKDQAGNFTLKDQNDFNLHAWNCIPPWLKGILMEMLKARDGEWPKVGSHTNATSLEKLYVMSDKDFLGLNIIPNYWKKLNRESMKKVLERQKMLIGKQMGRSNNGMPVVGPVYGQWKTYHRKNSTTESFLGRIPHVSPEALWSFTIRLEHYFFAFHLFQKNPAWGIGFKTNLVQYLEDYDTHFLDNLPNVTYKGYVGWHNTFENVALMFLVEQGGLFTIVYFGGIMYILIQCAREIQASPQENVAGLLTVSVLIGFTALSLSFDTLRFPSLNWVSHSLLGLLANQIIKRPNANFAEH